MQDFVHQQYLHRFAFKKNVTTPGSGGQAFTGSSRNRHLDHLRSKTTLGGGMDEYQIHPTMGTHVSFIFRGYNPYIGGVKPSFFMVLGSHGSESRWRNSHVFWFFMAFLRSQFFWSCAICFPVGIEGHKSQDMGFDCMYNRQRVLEGLCTLSMIVL